VHVLGAHLGGGWRYSCRFAARAGAPLPDGAIAVERHTPATFDAALGAVRCAAPRSPLVLRSAVHAAYDRYAAGTVDLAVSLNSADYDAADVVSFEFYDPPGGLALLNNTAGPELGGTPIVISGANLTAGSDRRCRFTPGFADDEAETDAMRREAREARSEVPATLMSAEPSLRCVTPRFADMRDEWPHRVVEVSLNGQQFSAVGLRFAVGREPNPSLQHHAVGDSTEHWHSPLETA